MKRNPEAALLLEMARAKHVAGDLQNAAALYKRALDISPRDPDLLHLSGTVHLQLKKWAKAIQLIEKSLLVDKKNADAFLNLGMAHAQLENRTKALWAYRSALRIDPNMADAYFNMARIHFEAREYDEAIALYQSALRIKPDDPQVLVNLGNCYKYMSTGKDGLWRKAWDAYEQAVMVQPNTAEAYANMGAILLDRGWFYSAAVHYSRALKAAPNLLNYRFMRSLAVMRLGRLADGWEDFEYRALAGKESIIRRPIPPPFWNGEDLAGKRIFVWREQGMGEQIIFSSMLPDLCARAEHVSLDAMPRLAAVFKRSFPNVNVLQLEGKEERMRVPEGHDFQITIGSLGRFFRRTLEDFPPPNAYLAADPVKTAALREKYQALAAGRRIVGLSWRSKNEALGPAKSAELTDWPEILRAPNVWFVNLQYGECAEELATVKEKLGIDVYCDPTVDPMGDLDDFFAQVAALDLVISTSNTTVHVAGSLSVPCWVLLPRTGGLIWYWFLDRSDSPWYPSLKFYRQRRAAGDTGESPHVGDEGWWRRPAARIGADLATWARTDG